MTAMTLDSTDIEKLRAPARARRQNRAELVLGFNERGACEFDLVAGSRSFLLFSDKYLCR